MTVTLHWMYPICAYTFKPPFLFCIVSTCVILYFGAVLSYDHKTEIKAYLCTYLVLTLSVGVISPSDENETKRSS